MDIATILAKKFKGAEWILDGNSYENLIWLDETTNKPTKKKLESLWSEVQEEIENESFLKEEARKSAMSKLKALGLTDDEISALVP